jgi:ABC-2 type transport system permease protein
MSALSGQGVSAPGPAPVPERGSFRGLSDLSLVVRQVGFEQLSFWLNPIGALMTIAFSVVFLILLGATAGKSTVGSYGGIKLIEYYVAGFCGYGVMASCFTILAITLVNRRETGLLKRLRLSPLPTWMLMDALIINAMIVAALGVLLLLVVGWIGYGVSAPAHWLPFIVTLLVAMVCYSAMGVGMSTLVPNADAAGPMVSLTFFILVALSGLWFPIAPGSGLATFADYFPIRHLINALVGSFTGQPGASYWPWRDLGVMLIWGAAGIVVGLRRWSWSPRRG